MFGPSHWRHEISLPKQIHHHFWAGLIPLAKNTPPIAININWFMDALTIFFNLLLLLFEGIILIGPSSIFLENLALFNKSTVLDPSRKMEINVLHYSSPFWFIYMRVEL